MHNKTTSTEGSSTNTPQIELDYAPKEHSTKSQIAYMLKLLAVTGFFIVMIWLFER
jgi:flagellar biogenesis protein FliO